MKELIIIHDRIAAFLRLRFYYFIQYDAKSINNSSIWNDVLETNLQFTGPLVHWFTGALVHWFTGALVHWFTGALVHWFTGALVRRCTGALVRRCTGALLHCWHYSLLRRDAIKEAGDLQFGSFCEFLWPNYWQWVNIILAQADSITETLLLTCYTGRQCTELRGNWFTFKCLWTND